MLGYGDTMTTLLLKHLPIESAESLGDGVHNLQFRLDRSFNFPVKIICQGYRSIRGFIPIRGQVPFRVQAASHIL
jgi:hypothetical protein